MEKTFLKQLRSGQREAQRQLYDMHADRLMHTITRYIDDQGASEEVLQDVFIKIFSKIKQYDSNKGSFKAWSYTIAINESLSHLRKTRRLAFSLEDQHQAKATIVECDNITSIHHNINDYLDKLNEKQALVFKLRAIEGFEYHEIQTMLDISSSANTRKIFSTARKQLQYLFSLNHQNGHG